MRFYLVIDNNREQKERYLIIEIGGIFYSVCLDRDNLLKQNWSRNLKSLVNDLKKEDYCYSETKEPDYYEVKEMKPV